MKLATEIIKKLRTESCHSMDVSYPKIYHELKREIEKSAKVPVVSKSSLVDFMADPYKHHWKQASGEQEKSDALRKGALIDCLTLTPDLISEQYVIADVNRRTNEGKARVAAAQEAGKEIISLAEYEAANRIASMARRELQARLGEYKTQVACYILVDELNNEKLATPVIITGMFDLLPTNENAPLTDLKTTSRPITNRADINRNMAEYGYGVQAALYVDLARFALGQDRWFNFFYVSLDEPTRMRWVLVNNADLELYRQRYYEAVKSYAYAWKFDDWGSAILTDMVYDVPAWDASRGTACVAEKGGEND